VKKIAAQSLLPLLGSGHSEIKLEISTQPEKTLQGDPRNKNPFQIITDNHPLATTIAGAFVSESGSTIKKVFLSVSKEDYRNINQTHRPVTNADIDLLWQESFLFHQKNHPDSLIALPSQIDSDLRLKPYKPLFFCCQTHTFFHPPCPVCAKQLEQCYDDEVLSRAGLELYNNSSRRYLYCPDCFSSKGPTAFYVHERHASDPPTVHDRWQLISDFNHLVEGDFDPNTLPCFTCQHVIECYGTGTDAVNHLTSFAFYNFFLLIHNAPSLHPMDFLALAAGALPAEICNVLEKKGEYGRQKNIRAFFPKDNPNFTFFLAEHDNWPAEVLFLKISFLAQLLEAVRPHLGRQNYPDFFLPLDQFWLKIADYDKHLPFCWNFKTAPIGPGLTSGSADNKQLKPPAASTLFTMAQIWFSAIYSNKNNTIKDVQDALAGLLDEKALNDFTVFEQNAASGKIHFQKPENILWNSGATVTVDFMQPFLVRAVKLGWQLFRASYNLEPDWSMATFTREVDDFAEELKTALRQIDVKSHGLSGTTDQASSQKIEDNAINDILDRILARWQPEPETSPPPPTEDVDRTQILPPDIRPDAPEHAAESSAADDKAEAILETQILQRPETDHEKPAQAFKEPAPLDDIMETRILTPDQMDTRTEQSHPVPETSQQQDMDIEETVIISSSTIKRSTAPPVQSTSPAPSIESAAKPKADRTAESDEASDQAESANDDLSETVIISPEDLAKLRRRS